MTIWIGRVGGRDGGAIDYGVLSTSTMAASGVTVTTFLSMPKPETAVALNRRTDTRSDFKNHFENSNVLREVYRNKFQFNQASGSNDAILIDYKTFEAFNWKEWRQAFTEVIFGEISVKFNCTKEVNEVRRNTVTETVILSECRLKTQITIFNRVECNLDFFKTNWFNVSDARKISWKKMALIGFHLPKFLFSINTLNENKDRTNIVRRKRLLIVP